MLIAFPLPFCYQFLFRCLLFIFFSPIFTYFLLKFYLIAEKLLSPSAGYANVTRATANKTKLNETKTRRDATVSNTVCPQLKRNGDVGRSGLGWRWRLRKVIKSKTISLSISANRFDSTAPYPACTSSRHSTHQQVSMRN